MDAQLSPDTTIPRIRRRTKRRRPRPVKLAPITRGNLDGRTLAARQWETIVTQIRDDCSANGTELTLVQLAMVEAFAGLSVQLDALNTDVLLGKSVDQGPYCQLITTMVRVGSRLGVKRKPKEIGQTLPPTWTTRSSQSVAMMASGHRGWVASRWQTMETIMTESEIIAALAGTWGKITTSCDTDPNAARIAEIKAHQSKARIKLRLAKLGRLERKLRASRRRFRLAAFLAWNALARQRRVSAQQSGGR
jgi:hypothetical protein